MVARRSTRCFEEKKKKSVSAERSGTVLLGSSFRRRRRRRRGLATTLVVAYYLTTRGAEAFLETVWLKQHEIEEEQRLIPAEAIPRRDTIIGYVGRVVFHSVVNRPTPRLFLRLVAGTTPDEASTLCAVATTCNLVYCGLVVLGFFWLPRGTMLVLTACTYPVGPALVFVILGGVVGVLLACAAYPMTVVLCLWLANFAKTTAFQALGNYLNLDLDRDGDVDLLDLLGPIAHSRVGRILRLPALHRRLNAKTEKPVMHLAHKVDTLDARIKALTALVEDLIALKKREAHAHRSSLWETGWGHDDLLSSQQQQQQQQAQHHRRNPPRQ